MTNDDRFIIYKMFVCIMRALMILMFPGLISSGAKRVLREDYQHFCKSLDESWNWVARSDVSPR